MVEIMSQGSRQEILKLPKNIRQIGLPEEKKKIYVEDYVVTYMNQLASEHPNEQRAAVLLGFYSKQRDVKLTFIHGAIGIPAAKVDEDSISFNSDVWEEIYNTIDKYFPKSEIVGWFLTRPGKTLGVNEKITKIHVDHFPGKEKTLFMMDPLDKEEAFFIYENGKLVRQQGYYIYYERNEEMQNYMVEQRAGKGSEDMLETADINRKARVSKDTEKIKNQKVQKGKLSRKITGAIVAALALVVVGMNIMELLYKQEASQSVANWIEEEPLTIQIPEETVEWVEETELKQEMVYAQETNDVAANASTGIRYTVRKGDTLVNISIGLYNDQDYVDLICELNNIDDPDLIYEGMVLELP